MDGGAAPLRPLLSGRPFIALHVQVEVTVTENPYDSPSSVTTKPVVEPHRKTTTRPVGVSILAALHLVGGVLLFGAQFLVFANLEAIEESLRVIGISPVLLIIGATFLALLSIASGVGMWMGTKWGWWLAFVL